jgi:hypothetical protein
MLVDAADYRDRSTTTRCLSDLSVTFASLR